MKKIAAIIGITAFCALIYYCVSYIQSPVSTLAAYTVTHEELFSCDAYIVRQETVYTAPCDGTLYSYAREGSRVGRSRNVAAVYNGSISEDILKELSTIETKIQELSTTVIDENDFMADGGSAQKRLVAIQQGIDEAAAVNNVAAIAEYKREIESIAAGETIQTNTDALASLQQQKAELESRITGPKTDIVSEISGIYSTAVDGFEQILTPEAAENMTVEGFAKIKPEQAPEHPAQEKDDNEIEPDVYQGDRICKVIDNHEWYVMALADKEDVASLKKGQNVKIRFSKLPGEETPAVVQSVSNEDPKQNKTVLLLKCESYSEGAFSIRTSEIEVVTQSYSGFRVPVHSVRVSDGKNGVMVRWAGKEVFKPCQIIYRDDENGFVIVTPDTADPNEMLMKYDMIILGEK